MLNQIELLPKQDELIYGVTPGVDVDVCLYVGGVGSGKTFINSYLGLKLCLEYGPMTGIACGPTHDQTTTTLVERGYMAHLARGGYLKQEDWTYNYSRKQLKLMNGSEIHFYSNDSPDAMMSNECSWGSIDEGGLCDEVLFTNLLTRLREGKLKPARIWLTGNPEQRRGWVADKFDDCPRVEVVEIGGETVRIGYRKVHAPTSENIVNLGAAYIALQQSSMDERTYKRLVDGLEDSGTDGVVCYNFDKHFNVDSQLAYRKDLPLYLTCDFNYDPMCWSVAQIVGGGLSREYHFLDNINLEGAGSEQAIELFAARWAFHRRLPLIITGDSSGGNRTTQGLAGQSKEDRNQGKMTGDYRIIKNTLHRLGWQKISFDIVQNPLIVERVQAWNTKMCNWLGFRGIKFHPRCEKSIFNASNLKYAKGSGRTLFETPTVAQITKNEKLKFLGHQFDADSYLVNRYDPVKNEAIKKGSHTIVNRNRISGLPQ
jgi:hypothetical protein